MEPQTTQTSARDAVSFVRSNFPPGTKLRRKSTGDLYMIGGKHSMSDFWMMSMNKAEKGILPATKILREFELVSP
jgi:hypothetical protein